MREDIEKRLPDFSQYVDPQKARSRGPGPLESMGPLDRNDGQGSGEPSSNGIDDVFLIKKYPISKFIKLVGINTLP